MNPTRRSSHQFPAEAGTGSETASEPDHALTGAHSHPPRNCTVNGLAAFIDASITISSLSVSLVWCSEIQVWGHVSTTSALYVPCLFLFALSRSLSSKVRRTVSSTLSHNPPWFAIACKPLIITSFFSLPCPGWMNGDIPKRLCMRLRKHGPTSTYRGVVCHPFSFSAIRIHAVLSPSNRLLWWVCVCVCPSQRI